VIQTAIAKMMMLFPGTGFHQPTIDKYNAMVRNESEQIRDFLVLHYTATERDDVPFWRHCRSIRKPESLVQKIEMYESDGHILTLPGELFQDSSWFAVLDGQGHKARACHPFANIVNEAELEARFALISSDVQKIVATFPTHDEFIRRYCAAPSMPMRPM
jgi:tryptophan halogenase